MHIHIVTGGFVWLFGVLIVCFCFFVCLVVSVCWGKASLGLNSGKFEKVKSYKEYQLNVYSLVLAWKNLLCYISQAKILWCWHLPFSLVMWLMVKNSKTITFKTNEKNPPSLIVYNIKFLFTKLLLMCLPSLASDVIKEDEETHT